MSSLNYNNTVVPNYSNNLYNGIYVPINNGGTLTAPSPQSALTSPLHGDSYTSSTKTDEGKFDYTLDDGKISFKDKLKNLGKGLISPVTNMFSSPKNFVIGAGMILAGVGLMVATGGAAAPVLVALGVTTGAIQIGTGVYKSATAKTDAEQEQAWQGIGTGTVSVGLSVLGAKSSLKAAGLADDATNINVLQATAKCFKSAPSQTFKSGKMFFNGEALTNVKNSLGINSETPSTQRAKSKTDTKAKETDVSHLKECAELTSEQRRSRVFTPEDKLLNHIDEYSPNKAELEAVESLLNGKLTRERAGIKSSPEFTENLNALIDKSTPLKENATVYRTIKRIDEPIVQKYLSGAKPGEIIVDPVYSSTASAPNPYAMMHLEDANSVIFKINLPKGTKGIYIKNFDEYVLPRNNALKILDIVDGIVNCEYILPE